jgi:hypothetical protein
MTLALGPVYSRSLGSGAVVAITALLVACGGVSLNPPGDSGSGSGGGSSSGSTGSSSGFAGSSSGFAGSSSGSTGSSSGFAGSSSGSTGSSSGGSSGGSNSSGSSSGVVLSPACPNTPPEDGAPCNVELSCEYGSDPDILCNTLSICQSGSWSTSYPDGAGICPTSVPGTNGCPSSFPSEGEVCSTSSVCAYPQGLCSCSDQSPVLLEDAGFTWGCDLPAAGCPEPRPHAGTSCSDQGQICYYGECSLGSAQQTCTNGTWNVQLLACGGAVNP